LAHTPAAQYREHHEHRRGDHRPGDFELVAAVRIHRSGITLSSKAHHRVPERKLRGGEADSHDKERPHELRVNGLRVLGDAFWNHQSTDPSIRGCATKSITEAIARMNINRPVILPIITSYRAYRSE
jgi:hypothetical protein